MPRNYVSVPFEYLDEMEELDNESFGRLIRGLIKYAMTGDFPPAEGDERFYVRRVKSREDRFQASYTDQEQKLSNRGKAGANGRWSNAKACLSIGDDAKACLSITSNAKNGNTNTETNTETETNITPPTGGSNTRKKRGASTVEAKKSFGAYGWVKLTEGEYNRLINDFGQAEVNRCIAYVDESAQSTGNKNKWRDWNLVVRKCSRDGWGSKAAAQANPKYPAPMPGDDRIRQSHKYAKEVAELDGILAELGAKGNGH